MKSDYKLKGATARQEIDLEAEVARKIGKMVEFTGLSVSELINTGMKRFIATHRDFLPPEERSPKG